MLVFACLQHWYQSLIFFGPIPVVAFWVWFSGRRHSTAVEERDKSNVSTPPRPTG